MEEENKPILRKDTEIDSLEYGTPKGGKAKIYFDFAGEDMKTRNDKVDSAMNALTYLKAEMDKVIHTE